MKSVPPGSALSRCHTIAGARPVTVSSATAMSRSQLEPGKTMTAVFMGGLPSVASGAFDAVVFDDGVGEQLRAHRIEIGVADVVGNLELDEAPRADIVDPGKAQPFERMMDRLALRVENPRLERHIDIHFHGCGPFRMGGGRCGRLCPRIARRARGAGRLERKRTRLNPSH